MMLRAAFALSLAMSSAAVLAQSPPAQRIDIQMSNFKYAPPSITLKHGQPYVLHFENVAHGGHDFVARDFFADARMTDADRARAPDGKVELDGGQSVDIALTMPRAGEYHAHCSHLMHSTFGMKATVTVT